MSTSVTELDPLRPIRMLVGRDLSDSEIAAELGVARSTISHWRSRGLPQAVTCLLPYLNPRTVPDAPPEADVPALDRVTDPRIAEALAVLADEYEALNARGRESLLMRFWAAHPDLRERSLDRVVAWLGWRVIEGDGAASVQG